MPLSERWNRTRKQWNVLTYYQRFESAVAFVLTLVIALIVLVALYRLCVGVVTAFLFGAVNPLEHAVFQSIFGEIMTLLIALEFNHLIALLAMARKFIILDIRDATTGYLLGLAAITLALGATYRLMRDRSDP